MDFRIPTSLLLRLFVTIVRREAAQTSSSRTTFGRPPSTQSGHCVLRPFSKRNEEQEPSRGLPANQSPLAPPSRHS
jgi:hypothetical protein